KSFGSAPRLRVGGQELLIDDVQPAQPGGAGALGFDRIYAHTLPHFAGPAAVQVDHQNGLSDVVLGGFTYVDVLQISFIDPAVVRVVQTGTNQPVSVVGYGFSSGLVLRAWPSGSPQNYREVHVDNSNLTLLSSERMRWRVPDFGSSFRGFLDVEVHDAEASYLLPKALFYGHLQLDGEVSVVRVPDLELTLGTASNPRFMPPGTPVDIATDADLGFVFVLGNGSDGASYSSLESLAADSPPAWISIVRYKRNDLGAAAPMVGLGYFNLPPSLKPSKLVLSDTHIYVAARGKHYATLDPPYEDQTVILVYDRETRAPDGPLPGSQDRDILYTLPLDFSTVPTTLAVADDLLLAASGEDGLAVISLANPLRPSLIKTVKDIHGRRGPFNESPVPFLEPLETRLDIAELYGRHAAYDLTRPSLPELVNDDRAGRSARPRGRAMLAQSAGMLDLRLYDVGRPSTSRLLGAYDPLGFRLDGGTAALMAETTVFGTFGAGYVAFFDASRPEQIGMLDAVSWQALPGEYPRTAELATDGVAVLATNQRLLLIDTRVLDLISSLPAAGASAVPTSQPLQLRFNQVLDQDAVDDLVPYVSFKSDGGTTTGQALDFTLVAQDPPSTTVVLNPDAGLLPNHRYRIELSPDLTSRRTLGLFEHAIAFETASSGSPAPRISAITPRVVPASGGSVQVTVEHAEGPVFTVGGEPADAQFLQDLGNGTRRYSLSAPASSTGPAAIEALNVNGARDVRVGAIEYVAPLRLISSSPRLGSSNGGTLITIIGEGIRPGAEQVHVYFGDVEADASTIRVLDGTKLEVRAPSGKLGSVSISVQIGSGPRETLPAAFEYQQPIQANIADGGGRIYDMVIDPTGTYLVTAAGAAGVVIYNIDASTFTGPPRNLNADILRGRVDLDGNGSDDRIVAQVGVGGTVLGVDTYFERGLDRVVATTASGEVVVIAFDPINIKQASVVARAPLYSGFARGVDATNSRALVAMGSSGIGLVDIFLEGKSYLADSFALPSNHAALDVVQLPRVAGYGDLYAVSAGHYSVVSDELLDATKPETGGFYIVEHTPARGFAVLGSLAVPSSRIAISRNFAYLAAGSAGIVIVDISNPAQPKVVRRVTDYGTAYDVAIDENTLYVARGTQGILSLDVTNPAAPIAAGGLESFAANDIHAVVAGDFSAIGGGAAGSGTIATRVVQVSPDVILRVSGVDPDDGILDYDALGRLQVRMHFSKAIDLWPDNLGRFRMLGSGGSELPIDVSIANNDALLTLQSSQGLSLG
ncbi:MAG TPA: IPT/TIG domain-containing protein, partial [Polyangiales bacterium]|nr:IPT/TIG domain-containing protein [Polyangiales bacterium]